MSVDNGHVADFSQSRDHALRLAHQLAFMKISHASRAGDQPAAVTRAVEELIDACEAYTMGGP